jgi:hypothetical protein
MNVLLLHFVNYKIHLCMKILYHDTVSRIYMLALVLFCCTANITAQNRINHNGQEIFLSGINLAWIDFAKDLTWFDEPEFTRALDEVSAAGGNCVRWWLHVNGMYSPVFKEGKVSGPGKTDINNIKLALDLAQERNLSLILCLWSFDMLQPNAGEMNYERNLKLLEDAEYTQAYIDNALTPMVKALKGHPAILCWEIFNEAEGMASDIEWGGWTPAKTLFIPHIQRFINMAAGAIHRADPEALVSNGCWSFKVLTDIETTRKNKNLYSDDKLIEAGKDSLGTLDFYMVHYYDWAKEEYSPFHHPASYWQLDKPIVVGEFSAKGPTEGIDIIAAYNSLYHKGYAGALSWSWQGHDGHGSLRDAAPALLFMKNNYPRDIIINYTNN